MARVYQIFCKRCNAPLRDSPWEKKKHRTVCWKCLTGVVKDKKETVCKICKRVVKDSTRIYHPNCALYSRGGRIADDGRKYIEKSGRKIYIV